MGDLLEPTTQAPPSAPGTALSLLLSKKALEASRTEILVLASVILFLASQVCLLVWLFSGRLQAVPAAGKKEERKVTIVLPPETNNSSPATFEAQDVHEDIVGATASGAENNERPILPLRRSSTWGGRSARSNGSHARGRRKSAGSRRKAYEGDDNDNCTEEDDAPERLGAKTSLSSPGSEPQPLVEVDRATPTDSKDMGRLAAALATPATLHLPLGNSRGNGGGDGRGTEATELQELDSRPEWREADLLGASIEIEKPQSPRSPRVLAADQAAMMDALCADEEAGEDGSWKAAAPSPVGNIRRDSLELGLEFDDPLGVNRKDTEVADLELLGEQNL